ncbi:MAG: LysR substrate-binding domain-containing protein [Pseudomonadota bacterium]
MNVHTPVGSTSTDMPTASTPNGPLFELDLLRSLVAIAETGNFSAASERLGRTPSAVSMQVKKMEQLVERPLFVRDSRSVSLTRDGEALLQHARRLLSLNGEMMARFIRPDLVGEVHLGAPDDVAERFLPIMLRQFADLYPGVLLNVVVDETARLIEAVDRGDLDLATVTCEAGFKTEDRAEIVFREPMVWACLAGGIAHENKPLRISMWEDGCMWRQAALTALERHACSYQIAIQSANISGHRAAILADVAVAPLALSHIGGRIARVPDAVGLPPLPASALGMIAREQRTAPVEAAMDLIRTSFAQHPSNTSAGDRGTQTNVAAEGSA